MKKVIFTLAAFIFAATIFTGCSKDEDEGSSVSINATVEDGTSYATSIDDVKAVIVDGDSIISVVASSNYTNGSFSLTLPKSLDAKYLSAMDEEMPEGIKVSNLKVNGCGINFCGYKSGEIVGTFQNGRMDNGIGMLTLVESYIFVDGDVTISGGNSETADLMGMPFKVETNYNLTLKKGWNLVYMEMIPTITETDLAMAINFSNTQVDGMKWYFVEGSYASSSVQKKMVALSKLKTQMLF